MKKKENVLNIELEDFVLPEAPTTKENQENSDISTTIHSLKILVNQNNTDLLSLVLNQNPKRIISHLEENGKTEFANFLKNFINVENPTTIREL